MKYLPWLIIAALSIALIVSVRSCKNANSNYDDSLEAVKADKDTTRRYIDDQGREHVNRLLVEGSREIIETIKGQIMDSVSHALRIAKKEIESIHAASITSTGEIVPDVDTIILPSGDSQIRFTYDDKWIKILGYVGTPSVINYSTHDSIVFTTYKKRKGLFKKETFIDGYSLNPNSKIGGITGIKISNDKPKRFSLGPSISYGFNGERFQPSVGLSFQYSLISF